MNDGRNDNKKGGSVPGQPSPGRVQRKDDGHYQDRGTNRPWNVEPIKQTTEPPPAPEKVSGDSDAMADHLWAQRHQVLYRCQLSTRYHRRRERFFDWMDRATNAIALIAGSAAFAAAADESAVKIAAVAVTGACAFSLVFGFADKARRHAGLAEGYKRVEAEVFRAGDYDFSESQLNGWRARIAEIEAGEPPALRPLVVLCQNDIAIAANQMKLVNTLPLHHRLLAHFIDFDVAAPQETFTV